MKDLTEGSILKHLLLMAAPMTVGMVTQIAYQFVNLYFVARIGVTATAGVNAASTIVFAIGAVTQVIATGTGALIAHAVGRRDAMDARIVFNQAISLSVVCGMSLVLVIYTTVRTYLQSLAADLPTVEAGATFIFWVLPGYALSLTTAVLSAVLRGAGIVTPAVAISVLTVLINVALAPVLISGWAIGMPLGVQGAGLATTISAALGLLCFGLYFCHSVVDIRFDLRSVIPRVQHWRRILGVGLPAGGDTGLFFLYNVIVYYVIRDLGADAQAGFGIGAQILQAFVLPGVAICFAAGPIAGQNFGARRISRVRETFQKAVLLGLSAMAAATILVQWNTTTLVMFFDADGAVLDVAEVFLELSSLGLVAQAVVTTCSSMFQGLGNTMPSLISSCVRFLAFGSSALWLSTSPTFTIEHVWYLSIATLLLQAGVSLWLLRVEFARRFQVVEQS